MNSTEERTPPVPSHRPAEEIRADLAAVDNTSGGLCYSLGGTRRETFRLAHDVGPLLADRERLSAELADARAEVERLTRLVEGSDDLDWATLDAAGREAVLVDDAREVRAQLADARDELRVLSGVAVPKSAWDEVNERAEAAERALEAVRAACDNWNGKDLAEIRAALSAASPTTSDDENACRDCGIDNPVWFAPNDVWNAVMGDHTGFLCPRCFIVRAETSGLLPTAWLLTPEAPAPAASDEPARCPHCHRPLPHTEPEQRACPGPAASGTPETTR